MAEKKEDKKRYKDKYLTITLKYREEEKSETDGGLLGNATRILTKIMSAVFDYNSKDANYGYSRFEVSGFYIDPDEMDVEEQNEKLNEFKDKMENV